MSSFSLNGECLDSAILLGRFNALFPKIDQSGNFTYLVSSSFDGSSSITYSLMTRAVTDTVSYSRAGFLAVTVCDPAQNYKAFTIPESSDFAGAWGAGFITPMAIGLVAWACSQIIGMWKD